ncbi:bifunctional DNA-formamidopyrimidine glycosylase/DNA-(apurinic or apyrimidinic site) lyase [bacterium]|nr:bifunctional DNA-formamidopyrimidine glycosylase/DNA-(apurinic or apyrimidinic site) lyase [bacterium]
MPELPEVETIVRALRPVLTGKTILQAEFLHPRTTPHTPPARLKEALKNNRIVAVSRRGKYILVHLENKPDMVVHLRMSGKLLLNKESLSDPHLRAFFRLSENIVLNFVDTRTFGFLYLLEEPIPEGFRSLGVEPLSSSFSAKRLAELFRNRKSPVKALLLRQDLIAGIGNIYASEACWIAKVHPATFGGELEEKQLKALHRAVRKVLRQAVDLMGTTLNDFRRPDGTPGEYGNALLVYGRKGEPCPRCGQTIERIVQNGRSSFLCPNCQHETRGG